MISDKWPKKVIYTAITGDYDSLITPKYINDDWDYICFTDNTALKSEFWNVIPMEDSDLDPPRKSRKYKILPHKYLSSYDCSLWIDGCVNIVGDVNQYINDYHCASSMLCMVHPQINCIYMEANSCILAANDYADIIQKQMAKYRAEGYPDHCGLIAGGILFREHNDVKLQKVMQDWWNEVESFSRRDQLSFNYVCWKNHYAYDLSYLNYWYSKFFHRKVHTVTSIQFFWTSENYSNEFSKMTQAAIKNNEFSISFYTKDCDNIHNSKSLRLDPANVPIQLFKIEAWVHFSDDSSYPLEVLHTNHTCKIDDTLIFKTIDPQVIFDSGKIDWDLCSHIVFSCELKRYLQK